MARKVESYGCPVQNGSRPPRVASIIADQICCAGRRRFSPFRVTASPIDRAASLESVRSTQYSSTAVPSASIRLQFCWKGLYSRRVPRTSAISSPGPPASPPSAARQPALFPVGCHVAGPESWPRTMIDRSSRMASFSARYGCNPGKRSYDELGRQIVHGSVVIAPVGATFGPVAKPWGHSGDRRIALSLESGLGMDAIPANGLKPSAVAKLPTGR